MQNILVQSGSARCYFLNAVQEEAASCTMYIHPLLAPIPFLNIKADSVDPDNTFHDAEIVTAIAMLIAFIRSI